MEKLDNETSGAEIVKHIHQSVKPLCGRCYWQEHDEHAGNRDDCKRRDAVTYMRGQFADDQPCSVKDDEGRPAFGPSYAALWFSAVDYLKSQVGVVAKLVEAQELLHRAVVGWTAAIEREKELHEQYRAVREMLNKYQIDSPLLK